MPTSIWETLLIILIAVGAKQVSEYMAIHPPYSCPAYCGVDHGHLFNGIDTLSVRKAKELPKKLKKILFRKIRNAFNQPKSFLGFGTLPTDVLPDSRFVNNPDALLHGAFRGHIQSRK